MTKKYVNLSDGTYATGTILVDTTGTPYTASGGGGGGTVTANAGTNLNTSALALETGGNLAAVSTNLGAQADSAATTDTGSFSLMGFVKRALQNWTTLLGRIPALVSGRIPVDGSGVTQPVSGTFYQATQPVSLALESYALTQTVVTVTTSSQTLIAANASRKYLSWMVIGTADVTISPATPVVNGTGQMYQSNGATKQGASEEFPHGAPTNAFYVIAAATGSTVVVWEGA
jgi:hypothetical protein